MEHASMPRFPVFPMEYSCAGSCGKDQNKASWWLTPAWASSSKVKCALEI